LAKVNRFFSVTKEHSSREIRSGMINFKVDRFRTIGTNDNNNDRVYTKRPVLTPTLVDPLTGLYSKG